MYVIVLLCVLLSLIVIARGSLETVFFVSCSCSQSLGRCLGVSFTKTKTVVSVRVFSVDSTQNPMPWFCFYTYYTDIACRNLQGILNISVTGITRAGCYTSSRCASFLEVS